MFWWGIPGLESHGWFIVQFELESFKLHRFSADKEELENLLTYVKNKCYVIVDGLDHINRQYDIYKGMIGKDETAIIEELNSIRFPDNFYRLLLSMRNKLYLKNVLLFRKEVL